MCLLEDILCAILSKISGFGHSRSPLWAFLFPTCPKHEDMQEGICMESHPKKLWETSLSLSFHWGAILLFLLLCVLIAACGSGPSNQNASIGSSAVTATIHLGENGSPTPPLPPYWCGAWATQTSPGFTSGNVGVYAKFTQNVNNNPVGVAGANALATVLWPNGNTETYPANTSADGLAVFSIRLTSRDVVDKLTLITVKFTKGDLSCTVGMDRAAFFTAVPGTPTVVSTSNTPAATSVATSVATATPTDTTTPTATATFVPSHRSKFTPTPTPGG